MDDVRAVMQAAGVERAALQGISEGGPASLLFAATYPDHVSARVIYGSTPRFSRSDDFPWGIDEQENARSGRRSYRTSASGTHTRGNILATSIASDLRRGAKVEGLVDCMVRGGSSPLGRIGKALLGGDFWAWETREGHSLAHIA